MPDKKLTSKEKYAAAFKALLDAQKEVINDSKNPFDLGIPLHGGLSNETFITDEELDKLIRKVGAAAADNLRFATLWNIGTDLIIKAKVLLK